MIFFIISAWPGEKGITNQVYLLKYYSPTVTHDKLVNILYTVLHKTQKL